MPNIPAFPSLPNPPDAPEKFKDWARLITLAIQELYRQLSMRTEEMLLTGLDAEKPTANGRSKFYFATDVSKLYYDSGSWISIN